MFSRAGTKLKNWTTFLRNGECLNQCRAFIEIVFLKSCLVTCPSPQDFIQAKRGGLG
jgi:hypothetical protein